MQYNFQEIEKKWQKKWMEQQTFAASNDTDKPKFYVLDMFPYPSGAGLHVGHPLGYIASDIYARYKRHQGYNVLHPIGYDSFGLPAEQYAIQTGQHPAITTEVNINGGIDNKNTIITGYNNQLKKLGFSFDWNREVRTSDPGYYKWTQWIFIQLFNSWYCNDKQMARPITELIEIFSIKGNAQVNACTSQHEIFSAEDWNSFSEEQKQTIILNYRLAYRAETTVNWCPALGTVLANDEVVNGVSERGGYPVYQKNMMQWSMRITAYSERLLSGLETIDWSESIKESQRNWIGKSLGAEVIFSVADSDVTVKIFTTRPDTIYGATYMVMAPEHPLVNQITTGDYYEAVNQYKDQSIKRSERERIADAKTVSGQFTGAYAVNPFTHKNIPIYIADYVLFGYGTGAIMAVPAHDDRDHRFAKHFGLPIVEVIKGGTDVQEVAFSSKEGTCINSEILNSLTVKEAQSKIIAEIEKMKIGHGTTNYRLRDAVFSRQRYWGEPIPIYYKNDIPYPLPESALPLLLPKVEKYLPTEDGNPPLGRAAQWAWDSENEEVVSNELINHITIFPLDLNTMPGWAGSSWYYLRYTDSANNFCLADKMKINYWENVDLYIGGSEHATGHLLYSRFWNKFLKDYGYLSQEEPFQKLINQGMILGQSAYIYRINGTNNFISYNLLKEVQDTTPLHIDVKLLKGTTDEVDLDQLRNWRDEFKNAEFILEEGKFICGREVEKMSKSYYNVINPDDVCEEYGADSLRMYEMFLGPIEQAKPWNTQGLSGVHGFLKKFWKLYHSGEGESFYISEEVPTKEEQRIIHQLIKKVNDDLDHFSFNTSVSSFMIATNDLIKIKCYKREILESLCILISPYAPHIAEELWEKLGHENSIEFQPFTEFNPEYLISDIYEYPVSFNGKVRFKIEIPISASPQEIEEAVRAHEKTPNYLDGKQPKKIIVVPKRIVNIVI